MKKRIAAILFATVMLFSCFSATAFADGSYDYWLEDGHNKATTMDRNVLPEGNIPDNSMWVANGDYEQFVYVCGKEEHSHTDACYEKECIHKHKHGFVWWWNCDHECSIEEGCITLKCDLEEHSHKRTCKGKETVYKWKLVEAFVVIWKNGDEVLEKDTNVKFGSKHEYNGDTPVKEATAKYTFTFSTWSKPFFDAKTRTYIYKALFTPTINEYAVTWKDDNGDVLRVDTLKYGEMPVYGEDPVKEATAQYTYTFAGWDKEVVKVTGDATYTATYDATVNKYTVTWKDDNGEVLREDSVEYGEMPAYGAEPMKDADAQYTYTFAGWDTEVVAVTGDATYTATYDATVNEYTVTWKDDNGEVLREDTVEYGTLPEYGEDPVKAADEKYTYTFAGWDTEVVAVTGDATYTATYDATEIPVEEAVVEDAAKTGDNMNVALYFGMMLFAVLGMIAVVLKKRNA